MVSGDIEQCAACFLGIAAIGISFVMFIVCTAVGGATAGVGVWSSWYIGSIICGIILLVVAIIGIIWCNHN